MDQKTIYTMEYYAADMIFLQRSCQSHFSITIWNEDSLLDICVEPSPNHKQTWLHKDCHHQVTIFERPLVPFAKRQQREVEIRGREKRKSPAWVSFKPLGIGLVFSHSDAYVYYGMRLSNVLVACLIDRNC